MATKGWFEVDREGLARILKRRGLRFMPFELISNAWDSEASYVEVSLKPVENKRLALLTVTDDDPHGFQDISHAYTLFADSLRRDNPLQRGRFNIGEKLVLAVAKTARITTTTGSVLFDERGRHRRQVYTPHGSRVEILFPATHGEIDEMVRAMKELIPPIPTYINGTELRKPKPAATFSASLETVLPDDEGNLQHRVRKTEVEVYQNGAGLLYELGVPVVETGDRYSYNVLQKVPVNLERDNVPPAYLRTLRVMAVNELHDTLDSEDANATWVRDALTDKRIAPEAVQSAVKQRFGSKVVSYDPSDPEANALAVAKGYTVVHGRQLSGAEWENIRKAGAIKPAGQVTPSPKPFAEDATGPMTLIPEEDWTDAMRLIADYAGRLFKEWFGHGIEVQIANDRSVNAAAMYGGARLMFNKAHLPRGWFEQGITDEVVSLLIHEGAHEDEHNHLSESYYNACCDLGAKMRHLGWVEEAVR